VVARQGLVTWVATGPDLARLQQQLESMQSVQQVTPFGNSLHITGQDAEALERSIAAMRERGAWQFTPSAPTLEDVFINLMARERGTEGR
jgi:ABC-2 type transport system ATP-binding protein